MEIAHFMFKFCELLSLLFFFVCRNCLFYLYGRV